MSTALLLTIVFVPVPLGVWAASSRRRGRGLVALILSVLAFDAPYDGVYDALPVAFGLFHRASSLAFARELLNARRERP